MGLFTLKSCDVCGKTIRGLRLSFRDQEGHVIYDVCMDCDQKIRDITKNKDPYPNNSEDARQMIGIAAEDVASNQERYKSESNKRDKNVKIITAIVFLLIIAVLAVFQWHDYKRHKDYVEEKENTMRTGILTVAEKYGLTDIQDVEFEWGSGDDSHKYSVSIESELFGSLSDEDKMLYYRDVSWETDLYFDIDGSSLSNEVGCLKIYSGEDLYEYADHYGRKLYKNGEVIAEEVKKSSNNSSNNSSKKSGKKCSMCNGTGSVKYYYGESDLEAILTGHDPYTFGPCPSCDGTGKE